jgi:uncharacterized protein YabE (DUF348 family)
MVQALYKKKRRMWITVIFIAGIVLTWLSLIFAPRENTYSSALKTIYLVDNGYEYIFSRVEAKTVGDFLRMNRLELKEKEYSFPDVDKALVPQMTIHVTRTHDIAIKLDGKKETHSVLGRSVAEVLSELKVVLDDDDIIVPTRDEPVTKEMLIMVTRVAVTEEVVEKKVGFEKRTNEDGGMSWRKTAVTQKGEPGIDRLIYKVSSHDGKEVNRTLMRTERVKEPVAEIVTQGTKVELGKSHTGAASWYAWTGTMAAANPWLPKGSYVKVTNTENGKSVIVVINDRGPFVPGRIIDLDKVAFSKIASVGAGVINVKMEEIIN